MNSHLTNRFLMAGVLALAAATASAQAPLTESWSTNYSGNYQVEPGSLVVVSSPFGNVTVEGTGGSALEVRARLTIRGVDQKAISEGRKEVNLRLSTISQGKLIQTIGAQPHRTAGWTATVDYNIRVPRSCNVRITTTNSDEIRASNLSGGLQVRNFNGRIDITSPGGPMFIDTVNGDVILRLTGTPSADSRISTVNGTVQVFTRDNAAFHWIAESLTGEAIAHRSLAPSLTKESDTRYTARINGGGKLLHTSALIGKLLLAPLSEAPRQMPVSPARAAGVATAAAATRDSYEQIFDSLGQLLLQRPNARNFVLSRQLIPTEFAFDTELGNIIVGEFQQSSRVSTGAGEIVVGRARGDLKVTTRGGPINLGIIDGTVKAETGAGNIMIGSAERGGVARTGGGSINVRRSAGPLQLISGGGDITVQEARGDVNARTTSGDITVSLSRRSTSAHVDLRASRGNVILIFPDGIRATIEATVFTSTPDAHEIRASLDGMEILRDEVGGRTRIRMRGPLNGGGPKFVVEAEEGSIQLHSFARGVAVR
jgi:DUF4097 and DUF4098 domain-containing protein YvlB